MLFYALPHLVWIYKCPSVFWPQETNCVADWRSEKGGLASRHHLASFLLLLPHLRSVRLDLKGAASLASGLVEGHLGWSKSGIFYQANVELFLRTGR